MAKAMSNACPNCSSTKFGEITPPTGNFYAITTVDTNQNPPAFNPTSGLPIKIYGCSECGICTIHCPSLSFQQK